MGCYCSVLSNTAISINKCIQICYSHIYAKVFTKWKTSVMCLIIWLCSFIAVLPTFTGWGAVGWDDKLFHCTYIRTADYSYTAVIVGSGVVIPSVMTAICYIKIYHTVIKSKRQIREWSQDVTEQDRVSRKQHIKLARTLFCVFTAFFITWVFYFGVVVFDYKNKVPSWGYISAVCLGLFNSCLNAFIYGASNKHFRLGYKNMLVSMCNWQMSKSGGENSRTTANSTF